MDRYTAETPGLFAALTSDEARALMDALITPSTAERHGFNSNRIGAALPPESPTAWTYSDIASEICHLHSEVSVHSLLAGERETGAWIAAREAGYSAAAADAAAAATWRHAARDAARDAELAAQVQA